MSTILKDEEAINEAIRQIEMAMTKASPDELPELLGELERIRAAAWSRLSTPPREESEADRLLDASEAAAMLGIEVSGLYRRRWPFRVEVSAGRTRYSLHGIQRFIRSREGR
jgi:hypothetical protein